MQTLKSSALMQDQGTEGLSQELTSNASLQYNVAQPVAAMSAQSSVDVLILTMNLPRVQRTCPPEFSLQRCCSRRQTVCDTPERKTTN